MFAALKTATQRAAQVEGFSDFVRAAACIMTTEGYGEAARRADEMGWYKVAEVLQQATVGAAAGFSGMSRGLVQKATVAGATAGASGMSLGLMGAFMAAVRNIGAFDTIAEAAMRFPDGFVGRASVFSNVASSTVAEGAAKTIRYLALTQTDFTPVKSVAQVVMSREVIDGLGDAGLRILGTELKGAVATGSDSAFLSAIAGNSGEAEGQDSYAGICDDLEELLRQLNLGVGSRPFLIMAPALAKSLAVKAMANGVDSLAWNGGSFAGVPILVSDAQSSNRVSAVDASGIVVVLGEIELRSSDEALVEMVDSSSQTSGSSVNAVQMVSMFQTNSRALRAERAFSVKPIRVGSFAHLTNVAMGSEFDSPMAAP